MSAFTFKAGHEQRFYRGFTTLNFTAFIGICRLTLSLSNPILEKAIIVRQAVVLVYGLYSRWIVFRFPERTRSFISSVRLPGHLRPPIGWMPEFYPLVNRPGREDGH